MLWFGGAGHGILSKYARAVHTFPLQVWCDVNFPQANRASQGMEETIVSHKMDVQVSVDDDEASSNGRRSATKEVGVPLPCEETKGTGARSDVILIPAVDDLRSVPVVVDGLRPRQVIAANLLVQGRRGKDVAAALGVSAETVSRWRQQPEFRNFMHQLLREHVASLQLSMIALTGEAITHLRYLVNGFSDKISLKACAIALNRAAPILSGIGAEMRHPPAETDTKP